MKKNSPEKLLE